MGGYPPGIPPLDLLAMTGFSTALAPPVGELARRQP